MQPFLHVHFLQMLHTKWIGYIAKEYVDVFFFGSPADTSSVYLFRTDLTTLKSNQSRLVRVPWLFFSIDNFTTFTISAFTNRQQDTAECLFVTPDFYLAKPDKKPLLIAVGLLLISPAMSMSVPFTTGKLIYFFLRPILDSRSVFSFIAMSLNLN